MTGMSRYSKYHDDSGAPFPGGDAVALAAGAPEEPAAAVKLCIDCRYCTDGDVPTVHANLMCVYPDPYLRAAVFFCDDRRRVQHHCGDDGKWFEDALPIA